MRRRAFGEEPCETFVANEKTFGLCRTCGCSLAEHLHANEPMHEDSAENDLDLEDVPPPPPPEPVACRNFTWKLDKSGSGLCECGLPKEEHKAETRGVSKRLSATLGEAVKRMSQRFSLTFGKVVLARPEGHPCESFSLDLQGEQYGLCKCGFDRPAHQAQERERIMHEQAAKSQVEAERAAKEARGDPTKPCTDFELDLTNKEGYGYCKCGFPRDQHMDFSSRPAFSEARSALTAPKPFT